MTLPGRFPAGAAKNIIAFIHLTKTLLTVSNTEFEGPF